MLRPAPHLAAMPRNPVLRSVRGPYDEWRACGGTGTAAGIGRNACRRFLLAEDYFRPTSL
jgi:hypothetical protein